MVFQAYRYKYVCPAVSRSVNNARFVTNNLLRCVPCGPVRSSFSIALDDVRRVRALGYVSAVRMVSFIQSTTI